MSSGIPGEIKGYWEAYKRWGKLPWQHLLQPSIDLCLNGFNLSASIATAIKQHEAKIVADNGLREIFFDSKTNRTLKVNSTVKMMKLGETLRKISNDPREFYAGKLADQIVMEINENGL